MTDQEIVALTLVGCAAAYLFRKLTGWPPARPATPPPVLSNRLARGLRAAERRRDEQPPDGR